MKSNYKRLGDYIQLVDDRNRELKVAQLLGLSIRKIFIPSVANIIGTNMKNYKIIRKGQFACSIMQVRRDKKMPIALLQDFDKAIISQAYPVFEVINKNKLLPEYLMMWFSRSEFDRQATFYAVGGVRGSLEWNDFLDFQLPIPDIKEQNEIVKEYNIVINRIKLNEQLNQKLEETAQALYKHWFVDFEFPNENGKPYKSNGGKMVYNEELDKEIPDGWEICSLEEVTINFNSKRKPITSSDRISIYKTYPYHGAASVMDYIDNFIFDGEYILVGEDGSVINENNTPVLQYVWGKFWVNNHAHVLKARNGFDINSLYILLKNTNVKEIVTGAVQLKINKTNLNSIQIVKPNHDILKVFNLKILPLFDLLKNNSDRNNSLQELQSLLLAKMTQQGKR